MKAYKHAGEKVAAVEDPELEKKSKALQRTHKHPAMPISNFVNNKHRSEQLQWKRLILKMKKLPQFSQAKDSAALLIELEDMVLVKIQCFTVAPLEDASLIDSASKMFSLTLCGSEYARHIGALTKEQCMFVSKLLTSGKKEDADEHLKKLLHHSKVKGISQPLSDNILAHYKLKLKALVSAVKQKPKSVSMANVQTTAQ